MLTGGLFVWYCLILQISSNHIWHFQEKFPQGVNRLFIFNSLSYRDAFDTICTCWHIIYFPPPTSILPFGQSRCALFNIFCMPEHSQGKSYLIMQIRYARRSSLAGMRLVLCYFLCSKPVNVWRQLDKHDGNCSCVCVCIVILDSCIFWSIASKERIFLRHS